MRYPVLLKDMIERKVDNRIITIILDTLKSAYFERLDEKNALKFAKRFVKLNSIPSFGQSADFQFVNKSLNCELVRTVVQ